MKNSTIRKCQEALTLSIIKGVTEKEACNKVDISFNSVMKYKKTEEGQSFMNELTETARQQFLNQVKSDMNKNRGTNLPVDEVF